MKLIDSIITLIEESLKNKGFLTKEQFDYCIEETESISYKDKKSNIEYFIGNIHQSDFLIAPLIYPHTYVVTKAQEKYIDKLISEDEQHYFNICCIFNFKNEDLVGLEAVLNMFNKLKDIILQYHYQDKISLVLSPDRCPINMITDLMSHNRDNKLDLSVHDDFIEFIKNNIKIQIWLKKLVSSLHTKKMICCVWIGPESLLGMVHHLNRFSDRDLSRDEKSNKKDDDEEYVTIEFD